jgi:hypothetical protein
MNLERLSTYIDPGLAYRLMDEAGVEMLVIGSQLFMGTYRPDGKVIRIDPDRDYEAMARDLSRRLVMKVTARDAFLLLFLHECGHAKTDPELLTGAPAKELEEIADRYALERFLRLKGEKR